MGKNQGVESQQLRCWCQHCKKELPPSHTGPCPHCGKIGKDCKVTASVPIGVMARSSLRARHRREGFKKFMKEIIQGWFPSGDQKLKKGVNLERVIDKEKDEYHKVVENAETGEIIREVHEPLTQHKSQARQPTKKKKRLKEDKRWKQKSKS